MENRSVSGIRPVLLSAVQHLLAKPNVVATGIGYKTTGGKKTDELSIVCSVETKVPSATLGRGELIPRFVEGVPTDVHPTGLIHIHQPPTGRFRPAPGGVSTGHVNITAGTLGCLVKRENRTFILSNNHVLANSNNAEKGDVILQPGLHDGGVVPDDYIAKLYDFVKIHFENENAGCFIARGVAGLFNFLARATGSGMRLYPRNMKQTENVVDCAIAEPFEESDVTDEILQVGKISGVAEGELGMEVKKSGRTTGLTHGVIEQVDATVRVNFGSGKTALFTDQLIAGAMSRGGDSGSVVLTGGNEIVGLLFAGSVNTTVFNRIQNVFAEMKVNLD